MIRLYLGFGKLDFRSINGQQNGIPILTFAWVFLRNIQFNGSFHYKRQQSDGEVMAEYLVIDDKDELFMDITTRR